MKRNLTKELLSQFSGQGNIISVARVYIELTQNHTDAVVLAQLVYWQGTKAEDEYFYKTDEELGQECVVTPKQLHRIRTALEPFGVSHKRMGLPAVMHYHVDMEKLTECIETVLTKGSNQLCHTAELDMPSLEEQVTTERQNIPYIHKTTTETTYNEEENSGQETTFKQPRQGKSKRSKPAGGKFDTYVPEITKSVGLSIDALGAFQAYDRIVKENGGACFPLNEKQKDKLNEVVDNLGITNAEKLPEFVQWTFDNWDGIKDGNDILQDHVLPPVWFFTSGHFIAMFFTRFLKGDKVTPKFNGNKIGDKVTKQQKAKGNILPDDIELDL